MGQQIKAIITAWFVDFSSFGGSIPENWGYVRLTDYTHFTGGYSYKGNELQQSNIGMATIKNFLRGGGFKIDGYKDIVPSPKIKGDQYAEVFDILVAHTDLTQKGDVIGNAMPILDMGKYDRLVFSMDTVKVTPKYPAITKFVIMAILQYGTFKEHAMSYINGTTVLHLSKKALQDYKLYFPRHIEELKGVNQILHNLYHKLSENYSENKKLEELRNYLLPRLMSGEIDVSELDI